MSEAAEAIGLTRYSHQHWMEHDPTYPERYDAARNAFADVLEAAAKRRAVDGVDQYIPNPKTGIAMDDQGNPYVQRVYSDRLMEVMLRAKRPSEYREKVELTGANGSALFSKPEQPLILIQVRQVLKGKDIELPALEKGEEVIEGEVVQETSTQPRPHVVQEEPTSSTVHPPSEEQSR